VVEQGTHNELMANGPVYQQMWSNYLREKKTEIAA
jgi:ABC-type multidrug transport system fused ATPase/permease subunit